jgi:hypothetical protein
MKKISSLAFIACASLGIILSSCSVIKRHYAKGYYVSHNSGKTENTKAEKPNSQKKTESPSYTIQNIHESSKADNGSMQNALITKEGTITASTKDIKSKSTRVAPSKKHMAYSTLAMGYPKENPKSFNAKKDENTLAADALSLFWIIIIILLILWLIAILTGGWGLGWTIHLLLVIALILLILWLLRII